MVDYIQTASNSADAIWTIVQILGVAAVVIAVVVVVVMILKYKHRLVIRELTGGKTRISYDRAKDVADAEGVLKWKLMKRKHQLPVPPAEAVHLTNKGKLFAEAYYLPEGEYKYIIDNGVDTTKLTNFEPLDTADREFYASEMKEAESYKKKKWTEYLMPMAALFSVLVILILLLVFWEDVAKPGIKITETAAGVAADQKETTEMLRDIIQNRQQMGDVMMPDKTDTGGG